MRKLKTFMSIEAKFLNKILSHQILINEKIIHYDRVELIPTLKDWYNTPRLINIFYHIKNIRKKNYATLSLYVANHLTEFNVYSLLLT